MPIMAIHESSDARAAAMQLARTAQDYLADRSAPYDPKIAMNNVFRMLRAYRTHGFFGFGSYPSVESLPESLSHTRQPERQVREVREALDAALKAAFGDKSKDIALDELESVLRSVAYPEKGQPSADEKSRALTFFNRAVELLPSRV